MNTHIRMFCPTFNLEYVSHDLGYYFAFINFITWILTRVVTMFQYPLVPQFYDKGIGLLNEFVVGWR